MKKIATVVLALSLTLFGASSASADQTCVEKILDPIIQIPVSVCVDVPILPTIPSLPSVPGVDPIVVPPVVEQPAPPTTDPVEPAPVEPPTGVEDERPAVSPLSPGVEEDRGVGIGLSRIDELAFPFMVFLGFLALLFGGAHFYGFLKKKFEKRLTPDPE